MRKLLSCLLMCLLICGTVVTSSAATLYGDVDSDGNVSILDATEIQCYIASLIELDDAAIKNADVDADSEVSILDATCVQLYLADFIDEFPASKKNQDLSLYRPIIKEVLNVHDGLGYYDAIGGLYDIDGNGISELVMLYTIPDAKVPGGDFKYYGDVYSIYTMDGDKVIPLVEEELLFMHAGGPSGKVYLMENGTESFIAFKYTEANPGYGDEWYVMGDWDFYYINGTKLSKHRNVQYQYVGLYDEILYNESTITENGVEKPYKDFENWLESYNSQLLLSSYSEDSNNSLKNLYDQLG